MILELRKRLKNLIKIIIICFFCLYSLFFVAGSVFAPLFAHFEFYELSAKLTTLYMFSCHQAPDRCFWFFGYPVALCCRCLGFYFGVVIFGIIAIFDKLKVNLKTFFILFSMAFVDILINYGFGIRAYNTGNITRFLIGMIMALLFISVLKYLFERKKYD